MSRCGFSTLLHIVSSYDEAHRSNTARTHTVDRKYGYSDPENSKPNRYSRRGDVVVTQGRDREANTHRVIGLDMLNPLEQPEGSPKFVFVGVRRRPLNQVKYAAPERIEYMTAAEVVAGELRR